MVIQNYTEGVVNGSTGTFIGWVKSKKGKDHKSVTQIGYENRCKYHDLDLEKGEKYFDYDMIICLDDTGEEVHVGVCEMTEEDENEKKYIRRQFPIILFYAMTVHKSQGVTLKSAVVDLRNCTQKLTYTAITRVSSQDTLGIRNLTKASIGRLTTQTKEDSAVKEFYSHYVGIDIPKSPLIFKKE
jgi:ATP-dependent exoDNAse (exonuclease V) alpha subunit